MQKPEIQVAARMKLKEKTGFQVKPGMTDKIIFNGIKDNNQQTGLYDEDRGNMLRIIGHALPGLGS